MNNWIDLRGASGQLYRYQLAENARPRTAVSGAYVYVKHAKGGPQIVFAGQTLNLSEGAAELWPQAVKEFGATHLYYRLHVSSAAREAEIEDLTAAELPPMNEALQPH